MLLEPAVGGGEGFIPRVGIDLIGTKDGANLVFTTPDPFLNSADQKIAVYWNARRLYQDRDFTVHEAGGAGTGYNQVRLAGWNTVGFLPRSGDELVADYFLDTNF